jgi:hypothetical protein
MQQCLVVLGDGDYELAQDGKIPDLLHQGVLTMPIYRVERNRAGGGTSNVPVPDFTYTNACLAQMIVDAWADQNFQAALLQREADHITVTPAAAQLEPISKLLTAVDPI